jgi:integrase
MTPDAARREAGAILKQARDAAEGKIGAVDPAISRQKIRSMPRLSSFVDDFIEAERKSGRRKRTRDLVAYLTLAKKLWGARPVNGIARADVARAVRDIAEDGERFHTANRFRSEVSALFTAALKAGHVTVNPAYGVDRYPERPRQRVLSDEEAKRLAEALDRETDPTVAGAFRILLGTACRVGELLAAKLADVNLEERIWNLPTQKSDRAGTIPLTDDVVAAFKSIPRGTGPYVISGRFPLKPRRDLSREWTRLRKSAELPSDIRTHDLRRSAGLWLVRTSGLAVAQRILRHATPAITSAVYSPLTVDEDLRPALEKVGAVLRFKRAAAK